MATVRQLLGKDYKLIHLFDTFEGLDYFYPQMSKGGIVISHDATRRGVYAAFEDYCRPKGIPIVELLTNQLMVVK